MTYKDVVSHSLVDAMCVSTKGIFLPKIKLAQENNSDIKAIKKLLEMDHYKNYINRDGVIYNFMGGQE